MGLLSLSLKLECIFHRGEGSSLYLYVYVCAQETLGSANMECP